MAENKKKKKQSGVIQAGIGVLTVILVILILVMMSLVSGIQGTARVVNYAGLVRGKTQRMVKMENAGQPQDGMLADVESFINGLRYGSDELNLVKLDDKAFQNKMEELDEYFQSLKQEVMLVREKGYENTDIIYKSEHFFEICDEATGLAEEYSQKRASSLARIEKFITADIVFLMILFGYEFFKALRYAAMNRVLQSKVYLDKATGLPNKNKCEELLSVPDMIREPTGIFVFDLNNLRRINNSMGHEMGDEYIRRFAVLLRAAVPQEHFVGRDGGDEFIAIAHDLDHTGMQEVMELIRQDTEKYCEENPDFPISYAVGYAVSQDYEEGCTMRELLAYADKNMYINKNHMKREEAAAEKRLDYKLLKKLKAYGNTFSDCLYCDVRQDTYRLIRASETFFLAADGSYSGAVEQIVEEQIGKADRERVWDCLQASYLQEHLNKEHPSLELQYQHKGEDQDQGVYGRLTVIFIDEDKEQNLHHFILAFETIQSRTAIDAKQQLTQYYEQLKQSVLENDSYVDALLQTADAIYSVNLSEDRLEQNFLNKEEKEKSQDLVRNLKLPCAYSEYCGKSAANITAETLEGYRLIDSSEKLLKRYHAGDKQAAVEYCEILPDGGTRWVQKTVLMTEILVYDPKEGAEKTVVHGMILLKDTTEFHEREKKEHDRLQAAVEEATTANKEKTEFLSRMSHDIRTPINGVMGMLEMIKRNREDHEKVDDCLEKIYISSEHLLALINDVLDMSKLEAGHIEIECRPFDLNDFMEEIYALSETQVASTDISYCPHREKMEHTKLLGSPLHLRQILLNLFSNSVKYNKSCGTIDTYVREIPWEHQDGKNLIGYEFVIADTGIGMSEEFVKNELFEPFTQEKAGARTQYKGTGLGMSIVKELTEKMNGSIEVKSVQGEGTVFTVRLPFEIDPNPQPVSRPMAECSRKSIEGIKVLLVEDNDLNMEIAEFFLQDMGAQVVKAWNGKEAVDLFAASAPGEIELIMMDIMMPVMNGLEAAKQIRAMDRSDAGEVVILAMTANAFSDDVERSRQAGMNEHLSKPLESETIRAAILRNLK